MYVVVTNDLVFLHFSICPLKTLHAQRHSQSPAEIDMYSEVKKLSCFCPFNWCTDISYRLQNVSELNVSLHYLSV